MVKQNTKITYKKIKNSNNGVCVCGGGGNHDVIKTTKKKMCVGREN